MFIFVVGVSYHVACPAIGGDRARAITPYLTDGQIINFQAYCYWPCLRVANYLKRMGKKNVTLSESPVMVHYCQTKDGYVTSRLLRKGVHFAAFPSERSQEVFDILNPIFPSFQLAKNVLQTSFENINMLVHPAIELLDISSFDRAEKREKVGFYRLGNTVHTAALTEALDRERETVCQAYDVPFA